LNAAIASTSKWDAADYACVGGFVAELGGAALDLLDPQPGERILDVGCGEGTLTRKIVERGATVLGIDNSPEMIAAARAKGIDSVLMDAANIPFTSEFDAAFSNATLHWVLDKEQAARAVFRALRAGGRFREVDARLIERPTAIEHGVAQWVTTFRRGWLDRAGVPDGERADIGAAVADRVGSNVADYVRLRFNMRKPN
jgi:SAM-dependent methyltransferase